MARGTLAMIQGSAPESTRLRRDSMAASSGSRISAGSLPSD